MNGILVSPAALRRRKVERLYFVTQLMPWIRSPEPEPEEDVLPPDYTLSVADAAPWIPEEESQ